jgi:hypothetical protein
VGDLINNLDDEEFWRAMVTWIKDPCECKSDIDSGLGIDHGYYRLQDLVFTLDFLRGRVSHLLRRAIDPL